jgi:hypothetical protein
MPTPGTAPPPSNAPSEHYRRHHRVEAPQVDDRAFRTGWRVHTRLRGLADAGLIDRQQLDAATSWGRWTERTAAPVTSGWRMKVDGGTRRAERIVEAHTLDTATKLRACAVALGPERCALLRATVVEDQSWRALGVSCTVAKRRVVEAVVALEQYLARDA